MSWHGVRFSVRTSDRRSIGSDAICGQLFRQFHNVIVVNDLRNPEFVPVPLGSFLKLEREQTLDNWVLRHYTASSFWTYNKHITHAWV